MPSDFRDRLKKVGQRLQAEPPNQPPPAAKAEPPAPAEPVAKKDPGPLLTFSCGHTRPVSKFTGKPCPTCVDEARGAARKARAEKLAAKNVAKQLPPEGKKFFEQKGRLPSGSEFLGLLWDAESGLWTGSLRIGPPREGAPVFRAEATGIVGLCFDLDLMYRKAIGEEKHP